MAWKAARKAPRPVLRTAYPTSIRARSTVSSVSPASGGTPTGSCARYTNRAQPASASSATLSSATSGGQTKQLKPLGGLAVLDVGCGGGLVSEPLARLGANVTGIDPTVDSIAVARRHAQGQRLAIDYRTASVEQLQSGGETFDAVVCMEVIEHVPDPAAFVRSLGQLVRPGGVLVMSTLNRTWKSYALAIVAAEYVLGWLPRGTHDWKRFVTTDELSRYLGDAGFAPPELSGIIYDVMNDVWRLAADTDVNYIAAAARPA